MVKIYTDGGSRGNPGHAASAYFIFESNEYLHFDGKYLGKKTNNFAEYEALRMALTYARRKAIDNIEVYLDSELVEKQIKGEYKIKNKELLKIKDQIDGIIKSFRSFKIIHIDRSKNYLADRLVNIILDNIAEKKV